jgi:methylase of polypeptide subunit release factors
LRRIFDRVGYAEDAIDALLGEDAYTTGHVEALVHDRRLPHTRLGAVIRACFLGLPVDVHEAPAHLDEALVAAGLAESDGRTIRPRARVAPIQGLFLASDGYSRGEDPRGYVATYTPTARTCDVLTPRRRVRSALDIGTGSGIHALLAARHSDRVVASDVNPRALAFTELNATLNGLDHVETRRGSLFEPVAGETFDLIVSNAPFVVSPETRFTFRDTELPADELSERIVSGAAAHLADDGLATLLVSWVATDPDDPDARPFEWTDGTGCDAWILGFSGADPLEHAAGWNDYLHDDPDRFAAALDEWTAYFSSIGVKWISEGAVLLHRRDGENVMRFDTVDDEELDDAGPQIEHFFVTQQRIADGGILGRRLRLAGAARIEREFDGRSLVEARLRLDGGLNFERALARGEDDLIASLDGAAFDDERRLELVEELLDQGFLEFA